MQHKDLIFAAMLLVATPAMSADIVGRASVIDGDTIEISGQRIRFDGIDAPEARQQCADATGKPYRCGRASAEALTAFLAQSRPTACYVTGKNWGRLVAVCRRADGANVNKWMVAQGLAIDWPRYSRGRYSADQAKAKSEGLGIWAGEFIPPCQFRGSRCD